MWLFLFLTPQQTQLLNLHAMNFSGFHGVNPGGVDAGMTQNVSKSYNILLCRIEGSGKQVSQVMGKDLFFCYMCPFAQGFHQLPYIAPIKRLSGSADKDSSVSNPLFLGVAQKHLAKVIGQHNHTGFSL